MTYYDLLGIPGDAPDAAIRTAFRAMARRYHPDMGTGSSAEKFKNVVEAYETLSDPARREQYDRSLARERPRPVRVEPMTRRAEPMTAEPDYWPRRDVIGRWLDEVIRSLEDHSLMGPKFFR